MVRPSKISLWEPIISGNNGRNKEASPVASLSDLAAAGRALLHGDKTEVKVEIVPGSRKMAIADVKINGRSLKEIRPEINRFLGIVRTSESRQLVAGLQSLCQYFQLPRLLKDRVEASVALKKFIGRGLYEDQITGSYILFTESLNPEDKKELRNVFSGEFELTIAEGLSEKELGDLLVARNKAQRLEISRELKTQLDWLESRIAVFLSEADKTAELPERFSDLTKFEIKIISENLLEEIILKIRQLQEKVRKVLNEAEAEIKEMARKYAERKQEEKIQYRKWLARKKSQEKLLEKLAMAKAGRHFEEATQIILEIDRMLEEISQIVNNLKEVGPAENPGFKGMIARLERDFDQLQKSEGQIFAGLSLSLLGLENQRTDLNREKIEELARLLDAFNEEKRRAKKDSPEASINIYS
jgi:hypothetical protein